MAKGLKISLLVSVLLNVILIIGMVLGRNHVRSSSFRLAAMTAEASVRAHEHMLEVISSEDPSKIKALADSLERQIDEGKKQAANWRKAAE